MGRKGLNKTKKTRGGIGEYDHVKAFNKTQVRNRACIFSKGKLFYCCWPGFILDLGGIENKTKKAGANRYVVTGVGSYEKVETAYDRLSPKPVSIRRKR